MTQHEFKQEHMPLVGMGTMPRRECDYCSADATWLHWADKRSVNRDAYACDTHVRFLNRYYQVTA